MATRRTPPRRRPRQESSGAKKVFLGGGFLIVFGLIVGTIMAQHHDAPHGKHSSMSLPHTSVPTPPSLISLLPPVRPETAHPALPRLKHRPKHMLKHRHPKKGRPKRPQHSEPHYVRFPVTPQMLLGEVQTSTPVPVPLATARLVLATTQPTLAPTLIPTPFRHWHGGHSRPHQTPTIESTQPPTPQPSATPFHHWHPRAHWTPRPHRIPVSQWTPRIIPNEIDSSEASVEVTPTPFVLHHLHPLEALRAEGVVRRYIAALKRGDEVSAYHALGGTAGDPALSLSEEAFIDHHAHIASLMVQSDDAGENIQAEVGAKHGLYIVTFRVEKRGGRYIITSHDYFKP